LFSTLCFFTTSYIPSSLVLLSWIQILNIFDHSFEPLKYDVVQGLCARVSTSLFDMRHRLIYPAGGVGLVTALLRRLKSWENITKIELILQPSRAPQNQTIAEFGLDGIAHYAVLLQYAEPVKFPVIVYQERLPAFRICHDAENIEPRLELNLRSPSPSFFIIPTWSQTSSTLVRSACISNCILDAKSLHCIFSLSAIKQLKLSRVKLDFTSRYDGRPLRWATLFMVGMDRWSALVTALEWHECGYSRPQRLHESYTDIQEENLDPTILIADTAALGALQKQIHIRAQQESYRMARRPDLYPSQ
jgi:hypothetical protein